MDKNAIKKYAIWAREELIKRVSTKAEEYGIREDADISLNVEVIGDRVLTDTEKKQRTALVNMVKDKGFELAMEEAAYTWFNRFIALRFMEVNGYLPTRVRVFTDEENNFKPQILDEAIHMELEGLNLEKVLDLKEQNKTDELYKYLIITQCNALHSVLPKMFPKIDDYTQLLFPDNILREGSAIEQMIAIIPEEDFDINSLDENGNANGQVEILGWLYQHYISTPKDKLINARSKYVAENVPFVTQLFTSDWIVKYLVDNTLGKYWIERTPNSTLKDKLVFYIPPKDGNINYIRENVLPEDITFLDPCMGSGHILVYAFEVFMEIYKECGYSERDAAKLILEKNLYGLDIDDRAYQYSYFALKMKARQYDRRFFTRNIEPQVYHPIKNTDLQNYGSLFVVDELEEKPTESVELTLFNADYEIELNNWNFKKLLSQKYTIICTNPPYMNGSYMPADLKKFIEKEYKDYKSDLFSAFIVKELQLCKDNGYVGMLTPYVWMFISSYEKLRSYMLLNSQFSSLVQLEYNAFEGACVPVCGFVLEKTKEVKKGEYIKLSDFKGIENQAPKTLEAISNVDCGYRYSTLQENFSKIPGSPIAYWVSEKMLSAFENISLYNYSISPSQNITGNNNKYVRKHWELKKIQIGGKDDWIFYAKGGGYRKWWGNLEDVINWTPQAREVYQYGDGSHASQIINKDYWYKKGITWGLITSNLPSFRIMPNGATFDKGGSTIIVNEDVYNFVLGLLNSKMYFNIASILNPTLNFQVKDIRSLPLVLKEIELINELVDQNISLSKTDWDSFETSWDFVRHPLLNGTSVKVTFENWENESNNRFNTLKANEEELNRLFIDIYGLQDELTPEVENKDVTVRLAKLDTDIKSFISYAVGCMFGRYSFDVDGLAYAGGEFDNSKYTTFIPDKDNVVPICDDEYFEDDIVGRFIEFVKVVYGAETLEQNLDFIASALGGKGTSRDVIRAYFLNGFYADHCKIYQKRPIYWQLDSGKKNGFKALIYMHRYEQDTMARVRTDYVHEQQGRYRTAIADLERRISDASTSERVKLTKQLTALKDQETEIRLFEEKIHHLADQMIRIDLDDGVKNNYAIFSDVLTKIK